MAKSRSDRGLSRRGFLKGLVVTTGGLVLARFRWLPVADAQGSLQPAWNPASYDYTAWEDVYRKQWVFTAAGRSTHSVNCTGSCSWKVFVKNGIVWRDEQAADYPAIGADIPEYNPRGCQKGACAADYQYGKQRLKYPLKRVGERGEGKWQRVSWDQALTEIADKTLDIIRQHGPQYLNAFTPIPAMGPVSYASGSRLMNLLGGVSFTFYDWYCDLPPGEPITWGVQTDSAESADWTHSRLVLAWGSNVNATRIPDAQMLQKARLRNGAKVVVLSPEYNPTSIHADQFVPVKPGSDLAVALAMNQVILAEKLYDEAYIKEQTDLPLLVREDTGRFLREADLTGEAPADPDAGPFYLWDSTKGNGVNQWYHNDLANRAMILLVALTGNVGRRGGGFNHYVGQEKIWPVAGWKALAYPGPQRFQNTTLWTYWHSEMHASDPLWPELKPYLETAVQKDWMPLWPNGLEGAPKAFFTWRANWLNQAKGNEKVLSTLLPKLDLIVALDFRMSSTDLYADFVLPAATWPEKYDLSCTDLTTFLIPFTPVVAPFAESRTDWQAFSALAGAIQRRAQARGLSGYDDTIAGTHIHRDLTSLHDQFTSNGALSQDKAAAQFILDRSEETQGFTVDDLVERPRRFKAASAHWTSDVEEGKTYTPFLRFVRDKHPWPTLTGRQQFYIDAAWYQELGVALPTYKPPLQLSQLPLRLSTSHYRHTIHSSWALDQTLQRLQWGEPFVYISPGDAKQRGIEDHDWVRVFNDVGATRVRARVHPALTPGQVMIPQGWEMVQFEDRRNFQAPITIHINPTQLVQYGHLRFEANYWGPTGANRDTLVDVEKA
ncbi:MAG: molybdopterin-dependent oxidoreductase [Deinococcales bacterium]